MSAENPLKGRQLSEEEKQQGADPFTNAAGQETPFSAEGLLNRNFKGEEADAAYGRFKEAAGIPTAEAPLRSEPARPLVRDRFIELLSANQGNATPGHAAYEQLGQEIQTDESLAPEERSKRLEDLQAVFASYTRNNRG